MTVASTDSGMPFQLAASSGITEPAVGEEDIATLLDRADAASRREREARQRQAFTAGQSSLPTKPRGSRSAPGNPRCSGGCSGKYAVPKSQSHAENTTP